MRKTYMIAALGVCLLASRSLAANDFVFTSIFLAAAFVLLIRGGAADPEITKDDKHGKSRL